MSHIVVKSPIAPNRLRDDGLLSNGVKFTYDYSFNSTKTSLKIIIRRK